MPQYVAQAILSEILPYMNIQPDQSTDGTVPETELWENFSGYANNVSNSQIDENGNLVDEEGNLIDWDGNRIDENGYLLNSDGSYQINANGEYIKSANLDGISDSYTGFRRDSARGCFWIPMSRVLRRYHRSHPG